MSLTNNQGKNEKIPIKSYCIPLIFVKQRGKITYIR